MRFILFDKIVGFEKNVGGVGIKNVTIGEDFFIKHYDRTSIMPEALLIECVAQVGGWIIAVSCDYKYSALMAKIGGVRFHRIVRPGDQLKINIEIISSGDYGSTINGIVKVDGDIVAEISKLMYVHHENSESMKKEIINTNIFNSGGYLDKDGNCTDG